jgi:hypothetical protein
VSPAASPVAGETLLEVADLTVTELEALEDELVVASVAIGADGGENDRAMRYTVLRIADRLTAIRKALGAHVTDLRGRERLSRREGPIVDLGAFRPTSAAGST